jgi:hypothetical protein
MFIYHINDDHVKNVTWKYYLGYDLEKYKTGTFYAKVYNIYGTDHIAYNGDIRSINNMDTLKEIKNPPRRKNVLLLNNGIPLRVNLEILDNYKKYVGHFNNSGITNLGKILSLLGLKCSHVTIIQTIPFMKTTEIVDNMDINHLYY